MERILGGDVMGKALFGVIAVAGLAFALCVLVYGLDSVAPGVHDVFHDFRHTIGMPCH